MPTSPATRTNGHVPVDVSGSHALLFFDGVCNLCNGFVNFVIDHDPEGQFKFAALQSEAARPYLEAFNVDPEALDSVIVIEKGRLYRESTAALRILRRLGTPWSLLYYAFIGVPRPLRDVVYQYIALNRYDWFGKRDQCRIPTPDLQARFLDA